MLLSRFVQRCELYRSFTYLTPCHRVVFSIMISHFWSDSDVPKKHPQNFPGSISILHLHDVPQLFFLIAARPARKEWGAAQLHRLGCGARQSGSSKKSAWEIENSHGRSLALGQAFLCPGIEDGGLESF